VRWETSGIENVSDFIAKLSRFEQRHVAQWSYRGHADNSFKLLPSLYRLDIEESFADWIDLERYMMKPSSSKPRRSLMMSRVMTWNGLRSRSIMDFRLACWTGL
jgi:hypothetical protein